MTNEANGQNRGHRLRHLSLPIGTPWFGLLDLGAGSRMLWPVRWQGWLAVAAFWTWLGGSTALFLEWEWQPDDRMLTFWFLPTVAVALLVIGLKTDMRQAKSL
jgi:hypothetical protein